MPHRITIFALIAAFMGTFATTAAAAPPTDFWQDRAGLGDKYFMNMAHTGGADEAPANTLFAFKTSAERGADVIEMDGYLTADGEFVITHDMEPHKTSDAPYSRFDNGGNHENPDQFVTNQTLAQLKEFDFAYKFRPGTGHHGYPHDGAPASDYLYRGIATGEKAPPEGFTANDFRIATFEEVLEAMPDMPMTVDMKAPRGDTTIATAAAEEVARIMNAHPERSEDVMIVSFFQDALERFHELAPGHKALGATEDELLDYALLDDPITPTPVALQPPDNYNLSGTVLDTVPILKTKAERDGYAIQVWPQNGSVDGPELWQKMLDQGAAGFFTDKPSELHAYLCENGIPRPDGSPRCPAQVCPKGQTGFAPDNCSLTRGTLAAFAMGPKRGKVKAGKKAKLRIRLKNSGGAPLKVRINLRSSNRQVKVKRSIVVKVPGLKTITRVVPVKATRKAKRKAVITVRTQGKTRKSVLKVKALKRKKQAKQGRR